MKIDKKIIESLRLWAEVEDIENVNFNYYTHDRGGVRIERLYKVFSDVRNYSVHIVFTEPGILIKEGQYKIKDLISILESLK